jgi:phosphoribosyl-ATP pyrophosphohydrolase
MTDKIVDIAALQRLYATILQRRNTDSTKSYTAKLLESGPSACAQKLGEEAIETIIAGLSNDKGAAAAESADLLYHLFAFWASIDLHPDEVMKKLADREGVSGIVEKNARPKS